VIDTWSTMPISNAVWTALHVNSFATAGYTANVTIDY
jgi:hypothetical protein